MVIKVIGKNPAMVRKCTCGNCASDLEYTMSDTRTEVVSDFTGDKETVRYIECPACTEKVFVKYY